MKVIHISQSRNFNSIMKNGLFRFKPLLKKYNNVMKNIYGDSYNEDRGLIFCFNESTNKRDKYIRDFVYWKTWGDNRNKVLEEISDDEFEEMKNVGLKLFNHLHPQENLFHIFECDIEYEIYFDWYVHQQTHDMTLEFWRDMDSRYEHDSKPLVLLNYDVSPSKIKLIGAVEVNITKKGKIDTILNI